MPIVQLLQGKLLVHEPSNEVKEKLEKVKKLNLCIENDSLIGIKRKRRTHSTGETDSQASYS